MARYAQRFKDRAVARLLPPESASVELVSRELGVGIATLERWRSEALSLPQTERAWTAAARLEAVITTASLDETAKGAWCREHGINPTSRHGRIKQSGGFQNPKRHAAGLSGPISVASKSSPVRSAARIRPWLRPPPCWCSQKNSRRSSARARTNDSAERSPHPSPKHPGGP